MKCYLCGNDASTVLTTRIRQGDGIVRYCEPCGLGMLQAPDADPAELQRFYREDYRKSHGPAAKRQTDYAEIFSAYVNYQKPRIDLLKPLLGQEKRLLEVGCSAGQFLYNVKEFVGEVVGVDYDANAVRYAAEKCQCTTYGGALDDAGLPAGSFDIAGAIHTMEHVEDPIGFASSIREYLKPDGNIFIEVPSLHDPLIKVYDNASYKAFWFQDVHLFYFTPQALQTVMQRAGFEGQVYYYQDYNLLNHLHWLLRGEPQADCHAGLGKIALPIAEQVGQELRNELQQWIQRADREYKALLTKHGATGNMLYIGKRVG